MCGLSAIKPTLLLPYFILLIHAAISRKRRRVRRIRSEQGKKNGKKYKYEEQIVGDKEKRRLERGGNI